MRTEIKKAIENIILENSVAISGEGIIAIVEDHFLEHCEEKEFILPDFQDFTEICSRLVLLLKTSEPDLEDLKNVWYKLTTHVLRVRYGGVI